MSLNKKLLTIIFIPSVLININSSSNSVVRSSATSVATGENAKTETSIETNINGSQTTVKSNSPGQIEVENINGQTTIRTSKGVTPTIIIKGDKVTPTISIIESEEKKSEPEIEAGAEKVEKKIYYFLRGLLKNIFNLFHR